MISVNLTALESLIQEAVTKAIQPHLEQLQPLKVSSPKDLPEFIDKKEAAKIASVSTSTIDNWRRARDFEPFYFGGSLRIKRSEFMDLLESKRVKSIPYYSRKNLR